MEHQTLGQWDQRPSVLYWRLSDFSTRNSKTSFIFSPPSVKVVCWISKLSSGAQFFFFQISFLSSQIYLSPEKLRQTFTFQFGKTSIFNWPNHQFCQIDKLRLFVYQYILSFKNCSFTKLLSFFCLSVSLVIEKLRELKENKTYKNWALCTFLQLVIMYFCIIN